MNGSPTPESRPCNEVDEDKNTASLYGISGDRQTDCKMNDELMIHRFLTRNAMAIVILSLATQPSVSEDAV